MNALAYTRQGNTTRNERYMPVACGVHCGHDEMSGMGAASLVGRHFFKQTGMLAGIAALMHRLDILFGMRSITGKWDHMVKRQFGFISCLWVNHLFTDVAPQSITLKNTHVVHFINGGTQFTSVATYCILAKLLQVFLSVPPQTSLTVLRMFFIFKLVASFFLLPVSLISGIAFTLFCILDRSIGSIVSTMIFQVVNTVNSTSHSMRFRIGIIAHFTTCAIACLAHFAISILLASISYEMVGIQGLFLKTNIADFSGERKQGWLHKLNSMVHFGHSYVVSLLDCVAQRLYVLEARVASIHMPSIITQQEGIVHANFFE